MALYQSTFREIFRSHTYGEKKILTWRGWRRIKLIDKPAALRDICRAFGKEFEEQRTFMEEELATMRQQIEAAKGQSNSDLVSSAPGYVFEELRVLFRELEKGLGKHPLQLPEATTSLLEKIHSVLEEDYDEQLRIVDNVGKGSLEQMDRLRRRLNRMAKDLQLSEAETARLRNELDAAYDSGVPSVYKTVQGLSSNETNVESKRDLLTKLFEANLEIRKKLT